MIFTFHNVSINSFRAGNTDGIFQNLHSIMYLLIHETKNELLNSELDLHSIMYLLIRIPTPLLSLPILDLHSIMYLLIQKQS